MHKAKWFKEAWLPQAGSAVNKDLQGSLRRYRHIFSVFWLILLALPGEQLTCTVLFHLALLHGSTAAGVVTTGLVGLCALSPALELLSLLW